MYKIFGAILGFIFIKIFILDTLEKWGLKMMIDALFDPRYEIQISNILFSITSLKLLVGAVAGAYAGNLYEIKKNKDKNALAGAKIREPVTPNASDEINSEPVVKKIETLPKTIGVEAEPTFDLKDDAYVLYLLEKYQIKKVEALNKFQAANKLFVDVDAALLFASELDAANRLREAVRDVYEISVVAKDSNGYKAGLRNGDLLISYAGVQFSNNEQLAKTVKHNENTGNVVVSIIRGAEMLSLDVEPGRMGIDGSFVKLDDERVDLRIRSVAS